MPIPAFVKQDQLLDVVVAITAIFRESDELRQNRAKARMKFLLINHGWTAERFLTEIERRIGYKLDSPAAEIPPNGSYRDHVGINAQQQKGLYYAGFSVGSGATNPGYFNSTSFQIAAAPSPADQARQVLASTPPDQILVQDGFDTWASILTVAAPAASVRSSYDA